MDADLGRIEHRDAEDVAQAREGPAPTISVKNTTPMPVSSRVSPRLKASRFAFCSA
jgi:hypothetical protein